MVKTVQCGGEDCNCAPVLLCFVSNFKIILYFQIYVFISEDGTHENRHFR